MGAASGHYRAGHDSRAVSEVYSRCGMAGQRSVSGRWPAFALQWRPGGSGHQWAVECLQSGKTPWRAPIAGKWPSATVFRPGIEAICCHPARPISSSAREIPSSDLDLQLLAIRRAYRRRGAGRRAHTRCKWPSAAIQHLHSCCDLWECLRVVTLIRLFAAIVVSSSLARGTLGCCRSSVKARADQSLEPGNSGPNPRPAALRPK
jgi:hypothetical protein